MSSLEQLKNQTIINMSTWGSPSHTYSFIPVKGLIIILVAIQTQRLWVAFDLFFLLTSLLSKTPKACQLLFNIFDQWPLSIPAATNLVQVTTQLRQQTQKCSPWFPGLLLSNPCCLY